MGLISTVSLPQEFYDITSPMLLQQPEPQYIYARMLLSALASDLQVPDALGLQGRAVSGQGADYSGLEGNQLFLSDPISQELFAAKVDFDAAPGTSMRFNRPKFTDSTYTRASRTINAGQTISTTAMSVESEQNTLLLQRFSGPHNGTNVAPLGIDRFSARLGVHNLVKIAKLHLIRDWYKTLDYFVREVLDTAGTAIYPSGMTAVDDATTKGSFMLDYETMSRTARTMDEANLPTLPDGRRILVVTPTGYNQLKQDPAWQRYSEFHPEINPLFTGSYAKSTPEFHVFKSNTLQKTDNSSNIEIHYAHAIAPGALGVGMGGDAPRVAPNTSDNYGEQAIVVWIAYLALGLLDQRFVYSVRYTEDVQ
jgi:hypothetical protein